jgi:hypothetical protein
MQAIHWGLNRKKWYGIQTLWNVVDDRLDAFRTQSRRYRYAWVLPFKFLDFFERFLKSVICTLTAPKQESLAGQCFPRCKGFLILFQQSCEIVVMEMSTIYWQDLYKL